MYVQCDVENVMNVWFKGEIRENRHFTDHVLVAHDQNVAHDQKLLHMIKKFELSKNLNKKLILVKNIYLAKFLVQTWKIVIFSDFGDMCHCGLSVSQAMGMIWMN